MFNLNFACYGWLVNLVFIEAKRQQKHYNEQALLMKISYALSKLKLQGYSVEHKCVSLDELQLFLNDYPPQTLYPRHH